jgi:release factor glutamine methyltransferase
MSKVYTPDEDSVLLLRNMESRIRGNVLDMGTGNGVLAIAAASYIEVKGVVAVDVDQEAIENAESRAKEAGMSSRIEFRVGDLFEGMENERFDWILFNPPYLPSEGSADEVSWAGGVRGGETVDRFLNQAGDHLNPGGGILLVVSSLTSFDRNGVKETFSLSVLEELPLFYERLYCLLLEPLSPSGVPGRTRRRRRPRRERGR